MQPQSGNSSLRKVRTFADDMRRAQEGAGGDTKALTKATSIVAPTITERSTAPLAKPLEQKQSGKGFIGGLLDGDLLDIRNAEKGTEEATIVTERKAHKWSFTAAVKQSALTWWKETLAELKPEQSEIPRVAKSLKRTTIVRAASMDAKIAPKDDGASLLARLKGTAVAPTATKTTPNVGSSSAEPRWGSAVDDTPPPPPVAPLVAVPKIARPIIRPESITAPHIEPPALDTSTFRQYSSAPISPPKPEPRAVFENRIEEEAEVGRIEDDSIATREEAIRAESARFAERARDAARRRLEYEATGNTGSSFSKYFVYGILSLVGVFLIVVTGSILYATFSSGGDDVVIPTTTPGITMLFEVSESVAVPLLNNRTDFLVDLTKRVRDAKAAPGSFLRYYFVYASDRNENELPSQAFIDTLDLRAPGSFLRTIDQTMMFGAYAGEVNAPFLVFKVKNFEDALGGMLLFEENMNSDLAPLFGDNLERVGQTGVFRDEVVGGIDTRSFYDNYGNMILTYSFIDRETIVITTSYSALGALAQVLK